MRTCPFCNGTGQYRDPEPMTPRSLRWTISSERATGSHVTLVGELTEQANLEALKELPGPVVLDLAGVRYINTAGSQQLCATIEAMYGPVAGERCSPAIVRQLNLMPDFSDHLKVRSVVLPYECTTCQVDHEVVVEVGKKRPSLPARRCGTCGNPLEPDQPLEQYFAFLPA
jgi:hypothetical protein